MEVCDTTLKKQVLHINLKMDKSVKVDYVNFIYLFIFKGLFCDR